MQECAFSKLKLVLSVGGNKICQKKFTILQILLPTVWCTVILNITNRIMCGESVTVYMVQCTGGITDHSVGKCSLISNQHNE